MEFGQGGMYYTALMALWRMPEDTPYRYWALGMTLNCEHIFPW